MKNIDKKILNKIELSINDYFQNIISYDVLQTTLKNKFNKTVLKNNIIEALIHALEHYEDDKDIHLNDADYELEQKNEIFHLLKCIENNELLSCKNSIDFLEKKEASFGMKNLFNKLFNK